MKQTRIISGKPIFWPTQDLKQANLSRKNRFRRKNHDAQLDIITINQNMHYQRRQMNQNRNISQNPIFWPILALKQVKQSHINFSQMRKCRLLVKHHCNKSKYAISEESNEPNLRYQPKNPFLGPIRAQFGPKWANKSPKNFEQTKNSQLTVKYR